MNLDEPECSLTTSTTPSIDYQGLVQYLIEPLLETPDALRIDCEHTGNNVWLRVAFDPDDRGRVFGRSGKTIQSIRALLDLAAQNEGRAAFLDVYGGYSLGDGSGDEGGGRGRGDRGGDRRRSRPDRPHRGR
jgi:predicted RNA-binding protein YlqC (UPF0109 family)